MSDRDALVAHLRLYADMGVAGFSRDATWRERQHAPGATAVPRDVEPDAPAFEAQPADPAIADGPIAATPSPSAMPATSNPSLAGLPLSPPEEALDTLRAHIGVCTRCPLHTQGRKQVVFGTGSPTAQLMFVGEAPGADEDTQGEPFVGRAGQLLTKIIEAIELKRSDVYIANVIKCRPPGNRNPEPFEVATCEPFLFHQIDIIRPKVIVALGTFAAQALLKTDTPISRLRGTVQSFRGGIKLVPTFHPAFLLRSPDRKRDVWEDMKKVRALLADAD
jgi:uracil-DNA glycosylase